MFENGRTVQKLHTKEYMVEKTYNLARYLGPFGAYLMPHGPIWISFPRTGNLAILWGFFEKSKHSL